MTERIKLPPGLLLSSKICGINYWRRGFHLNRTVVFFATFVAYVLFHAARKPFSVSKNVLAGSSSNSTNSEKPTGWAPFNDGNHMLYFSILDTTWASSYAVSMFINGYIAEHISFTYVLGSGLICSGFFCVALGASKIWGVHHFAYYIFMMCASGFFQSCGWPCIIAIMSYWFEGSKQGALFGIWSAHGSVGNIVGQAIAAKFVLIDWSLSFVIPGSIAMIYGFILICFLIQNPKNIGFGKNDVIPIKVYPEIENIEQENDDLVDEPLLDQELIPATDTDMSGRPLGFFKAVLLPGVIEYSLCLFFAKLVVYTFLFWLPFYIKQVGIKGYEVTSEKAGYLSLLFDIGGIIGGFAAGLLSDVSKTSGICCFVLQVLGAGSLFLYAAFGNESFYVAVALLLICGFFVNGPTTLISTAVSSGIASNPSLRGQGARGTVAGIIDGMGSLGSALGPFVVHVVSRYGWEKIMITMMISLILSALFISRQVANEIRHIIRCELCQ